MRELRFRTDGRRVGAGLAEVRRTRRWVPQNFDGGLLLAFADDARSPTDSSVNTPPGHEGGGAAFGGSDPSRRPCLRFLAGTSYCGRPHRKRLVLMLGGRRICSGRGWGTGLPWRVERLDGRARGHPKV